MYGKVGKLIGESLCMPRVVVEYPWTLNFYPSWVLIGIHYRIWETSRPSCIIDVENGWESSPSVHCSPESDFAFWHMFPITMYRLAVIFYSNTCSSPYQLFVSLKLTDHFRVLIVLHPLRYRFETRWPTDCHLSIEFTLFDRIHSCSMLASYFHQNADALVHWTAPQNMANPCSIHVFST